MERERNLMMTGKVEKSPDDLTENPVFTVNQQTNSQLAKTRSKLKTKREKNAERLIRQGVKWEREREYNDEMDRLHEIEMKQNRENALLMGNAYTVTDKTSGVAEFLRLKNSNSNQLALRKFLELKSEKKLSSFRSRSSHTSRDVNEDLEADTTTEQGSPRADKTQSSQRTVENALEYSITSEKNFDDELEIGFHRPSGETIVNNIFESPRSVDEYLKDGGDNYESLVANEKEETVEKKQQYLAGQALSKKDQLHYEDPMITQLKQANVRVFNACSKLVNI